MESCWPFVKVPKMQKPHDCLMLLHFNPLHLDDVTHTMKKIGLRGKWHEHMVKFGWGLGWHELAIMRNSTEVQADGNDLKWVHKALGVWAGLAGIQEGALVLFLSVNECRMCHLWAMTGKALVWRRTLIPILRVLLVPDVTSGTGCITEDWILQKKN